MSKYRDMLDKIDAKEAAADEFLARMQRAKTTARIFVVMAATALVVVIVLWARGCGA